jgi:hypothetical protein
MFPAQGSEYVSATAELSMCGVVVNSAIALTYSLPWGAFGNNNESPVDIYIIDNIIYCIYISF